MRAAAAAAGGTFFRPIFWPLAEERGGLPFHVILSPIFVNNNLLISSTFKIYHRNKLNKGKYSFTSFCCLNKEKKTVSSSDFFLMIFLINLI
jgi:hypothetical protein